MRNAPRLARQLAFAAARRIGKRDVATHLFCICEPILPLRRIERSESAVAFYHPRPSWDGHALVTPTRRCPALLSPRWPVASRAEALWATVELAERVAARRSGNVPYRYMIINGGQRQDVGHLHGHLTHSLDQAGFTGAKDPADDPGQYSPFDGVSRSPGGFATWLRALEAHQQRWHEPDTGFTAIFPLEWHGASTITIYLNVSDT